jgi:biopolymer transport protein ExbD
MAIGGGSDRLMSDINVTPFVDVMLVLLIIFMVTAPMMVQGRRCGPSRSECAHPWWPKRKISP